MREVYIELLTEFTGEETRKIWEDKIYGIGAPAVDWERDDRPQNGELPEEWEL